MDQPIRPRRPHEGYDTHDLFKTGDPDAPEAIKDRNGHVALDQCRRCGRAEIELSEVCDG